MSEPRIDVPRDRIAAFCGRWRVEELALFGSVLTDDFRPDSDIDILVRFQPDHPWSLLDHAEMQDELGEIFGREVHLVSRAGLDSSKNTIRRKAILEAAHPIYEPA